MEIRRALKSNHRNTMRKHAAWICVRIPELAHRRVQIESLFMTRPRRIKQPAPLRIAQLNYHGSQTVCAEARVLAKAQKIDIILAQQPWKKGISKAMGLCIDE